MSIKLIQERLKSYNCRSEWEEGMALREITQEVILAALGRTGFFNEALFQGGTCLRIFYGLNRFSEDLDFILAKPDQKPDLFSCLSRVAEECRAFGYEVEIQDRKSGEATVQQVFLKDDALGKILNLNYAGQSGRPGKIKVKLELDTNPPFGSGAEMKYLDFPFVSMVVIQDLPSLFAGKVHALLCREYIKGRDWYDFIWYTSQKIDINYTFLSSALGQQGPWQGQGIKADLDWCLKELSRKIKSIDWQPVIKEVKRFVRISEYPSLDLWSRDLFLNQLKKIG